MATYDTPFFAIPFEFSASNNEIEFQDSGGATYVHSFTAGTPYMNIGDGSAVGIDDFGVPLLKAFQDAQTAFGTGGTWAVTLQTDTLKMKITRSGGSSPADDIKINWLSASTTIDPKLLGQQGSLTTTTYAADNLSPFQAGEIWAPGIYAVFDSAEQECTITFEHRNLNGRPIRVNHNASPWHERLLDFSAPGIPACRMLDARAALAAYCDVDIFFETGETNTWEALKRYLVGPAGPLGDNQVYVMSTSDPATLERQGPYEYVLGESSPGLKGVDLGDYVKDRSSEFYPAKIVLWSGS